MDTKILIESLHSDISEDTKRRLFSDWLKSQTTPKTIKEMLVVTDIITKISAVIQDDPRAAAVVFDILTKYGTLNYPKFR